jgi:hypothetical protein
VPVEKEIDHAIDQAEVIVALELLFQVDEIAVHPVEAAGEEAAEMEADRGIGFEQTDRILDDTEAARFEGLHLRGVRDAEEGGEIAEDGAGLVRPRHRDAVLRHLDDALDEKVE